MLSDYINSQQLRIIQCGIWNTIGTRLPLGKNVYEKDWDVLVILDTARVDAMKQMSQEFEFISDVDKLFSLGNMSAEWMVNTFSSEHIHDIEETAFVAGNVWADRILRSDWQEQLPEQYSYITSGYPNWDPVTQDDFLCVDNTWKLQSELGGLHPNSASPFPHIITDRAINLYRDYEPNRMIVHYSAPHISYIGNAIDFSAVDLGAESFEDLSNISVKRQLYDYEKSFSPLMKGEITKEKMFGSYLENLRLALTYTKILINNVDAENVVISADHGEAFGEFGIYSHNFGLFDKNTRLVPWVETSATDNDTYTPSIPSPETIGVSDNDVESRLQDLGYL